LGLCSYVIPEAVCPRLADIDGFWTTIEAHGRLVDTLPGYAPEMWELCVAWDGMVELPKGIAGTYQVSHPRGARLIGIYRAHDLRVLHTRIDKLERRSRLSASSVFKAFGYPFELACGFDGDYLGFLARQTDHLSNRDHALVLVCHEVSHW